MLDFNASEQFFTNDEYEVEETTGVSWYRTKRMVKHFHIEDALSIEQKMEILDQYSDGNVSYVYNLLNLYMTEMAEGKIKADKYGCIRENTKTAWIRHHDDRCLFWNGVNKKSDMTKTYYKADFFEFGHDWYVGYLVNEEKIDIAFRDLCLEFKRLEHEWFCEHDEYQILKKKLNGEKFGLLIWESSDGEVGLWDENENKRILTIDELKYLIEKQEELESYKTKISMEVKKRFGEV